MVNEIIGQSSPEKLTHCRSYHFHRRLASLECLTPWRITNTKHLKNSRPNIIEVFAWRLRMRGVNGTWNELLTPVQLVLLFACFAAVLLVDGPGGNVLKLNCLAITYFFVASLSMYNLLVRLLSWVNVSVQKLLTHWSTVEGSACLHVDLFGKRRCSPLCGSPLDSRWKPPKAVKQSPLF